MSEPADCTWDHFAFLSVHGIETTEMCGGLLCVNSIGRPVEFHCSTPVSANRTQEILYGTTLKQFLACEQIGASLLKHCRKQPCIVLIHQPELLPLHGLMNQPLVLVGAPENGIAMSWVNERRAVDMQLGSHQLLIVAREVDLEMTRQSLAGFHAAIPVDEPFERIRQAIEEAQAVAR